MVGLTLTNPATILAFAALFASIGAGTGGASGAAAVVAGVFLGSVAWWALLTGLVAGLRARLTPRAIRWLNIVSARRDRCVRGRRDRHRPGGLSARRAGPTPSGASPTIGACPPDRLPAAAVFDWDGTLVDTMAMIYRANVASLRHYGLTHEPGVVPRAVHARLAPRLPGARDPRAPVGRDGRPLGRRDVPHAAPRDALGPRRAPRPAPPRREGRPRDGVHPRRGGAQHRAPQPGRRVPDGVVLGRRRALQAAPGGAGPRARRPGRGRRRHRVRGRHASWTSR